MKHCLIILICVSFFYASPLFSQDIVFDSEPEKLGPQVNAPNVREVEPIICPDGRKLYFCRDDYSGGLGKQDIWYSELEADGTWGWAKNIKSPLNNPYNNFICSITPDANTILLGNVYNYFDGSMSQGVSLSFRDRGGWTFPKKQMVEKFENLNDYVGYKLSDDRTILLMSVERGGKGNLGEKDIYVSFKSKDNEWTKPLNLGSTINTKADDDLCMLASDNKTLYFSSEGHGGLGSADIWVARRLDDTWTNWSKPINMGNKINSSGWESDLSIPASGEYAYFTRSGDIYRIKLPKEVKPEPVVLVYGRVLNSKTQEPIKANIVYQVLADGKEIGTAISNGTTGEYKITLPKDKAYSFMAQTDNFYPVRENLDLTTLTDYKEIKRDLLLAPIEVGQTIRINNIFFDSGKSDLKPESFQELNALASLLKANAGMEIEIGGHTDNVGSDTDNQTLSQKRTEAVVDYLSKNGVGKGRLTAKGYGEQKPIASNDTDEGRGINRRVEFSILKK